MNENVIKYVEEITSVSMYKRLKDEPFYVYILPKASDSPTSTIVLGKCSYNKQEINIPLIANAWNPILISSLNVTQDLLNKYSIFIGLSDIII